MADIQTIIEKVLNEESFRVSLVRDPAGTLESVGIEPTPEILAAFEGIDENDLRDLAESFDPASAAA